MRDVKCKSGLRGWECRLQDNYSDFEEFENYSEIYGLSQRLGFADAVQAWDANPVIQGSVEPSDFRVVRK